MVGERRETQKGKDGELLGRSLCPKERGGSPETGVPGHRETPSQAGPKGSLGKIVKVGTWRAVSRERCTFEPVHSSGSVTPNRWRARGTDSGIQTQPAHTALAAQRPGPGGRVWRDRQTQRVQSAGLGCHRGEACKLGQRTGSEVKQRHICPATQRAGTGSRHTSTPALRRRGQPGELKQVHPSPSTRRACQGRRHQCSRACDTEGGPRELSQVHTSPATPRVSLGAEENPHKSPVTQKDPHKQLPSKFRPTAQGGPGEQKHQQWSRGQAGGWPHWSYAERATLWSSCGNRCA